MERAGIPETKPWKTEILSSLSETPIIEKMVFKLKAKE